MSSAATYASIKHALQKSSSPLVGRNPDIFLQGSYANATNIHGDSDVDVVVLYKPTFHSDLSRLTPEEQQRHALDVEPASYQWPHLQADVISALRAHYGYTAVQQGKKSIKVVTAYGGRPADVIPAVEHRRFARYPNSAEATAHWGMQTVARKKTSPLGSRGGQVGGGAGI